MDAKVLLLLSHCKSDLSSFTNLLKNERQGLESESLNSSSVNPTTDWLVNNLSVDSEINSKRVREIQAVKSSLLACLDTCVCSETQIYEDAQACILESAGVLDLIKHQVKDLVPRISAINEARSLPRISAEHLARSRLQQCIDILNEINKISILIEQARIAEASRDYRTAVSRIQESKTYLRSSRYFKLLEQTSAIQLTMAEGNKLHSDVRKALVSSFTNPELDKGMKKSNLQLLLTADIDSRSHSSGSPHSEDTMWRSSLFQKFPSDYLRLVQDEIVVLLRSAADFNEVRGNTLTALIAAIPRDQFTEVLIKLCRIAVNYFNVFVDLVSLVGEEVNSSNIPNLDVELVLVLPGYELASQFIMTLANYIENSNPETTSDCTALLDEDFAMPYFLINHVLSFFRKSITRLRDVSQIGSSVTKSNAETVPDLSRACEALRNSLSKRSRQILLNYFVRALQRHISVVAQNETWNRLLTPDSREDLTLPFNWQISSSEPRRIFDSAYSRTTKSSSSVKDAPQFDDRWVSTVKAAIRLAHSAVGPSGSSYSSDCSSADAAVGTTLSKSLFCLADRLLKWVFWDPDGLMALTGMMLLSFIESFIYILSVSLASADSLEQLVGSDIDLTAVEYGATLVSVHSLFLKYLKLRETRQLISFLRSPLEEESREELTVMKKSVPSVTRSIIDQITKRFLSSLRISTSSSINSPGHLYGAVTIMTALESFLHFQTSVTRLLLHDSSKPNSSTKFARAASACIDDGHRLEILKKIQKQYLIRSEIRTLFIDQAITPNVAFMKSWSAEFMLQLSPENLGNDEPTDTSALFWQVQDLHHTLTLNHCGSLPAKGCLTEFWKAMGKKLVMNFVNLVTMIRVSQSNLKSGMKFSGQDLIRRQSVQGSFTVVELNTIKKTVAKMTDSLQKQIKTLKELESFTIETKYFDEFMDAHALKQDELLGWCKANTRRPLSEFLSIIGRCDSCDSAKGNSMAMEISAWVLEFMKFSRSKIEMEDNFVN